MLSALLGILGGAGLLGYLSEYATYNYAIYYGFRPPLEGVPYLRPAVAFGSLFLLLTGALVFALIAFALRSLVWYFDVVPRLATVPLRTLGFDTVPHERRMGQLLTSIRRRPLWQHVAICVAIPIAFLGVSTVVDLFNRGGEQIIRDQGFVIFITIYLASLTLAVLRSNTIWWTAILVTAVYFSACLYLLFTPTKYSELRRLLGYGGGISVKIELRTDRTEANPGVETHQLMLRTTEALILYDSGRALFSEIPRDQIRRITHEAGGMRRLPHSLPAE